MDELKVFNRLEAINAVAQFGELYGDDMEKAKRLAAHKAWLQSIRHERPSVTHPFKVGLYPLFQPDEIRELPFLS